MKYCPTCGDTFGDETKFCPKDGSALTQKGQTGDPMIGKRLLNKWEVLSKIGAGGFGTVYKVRDVRLNHVEALKVFDRRRLHPDEAEEALARFQREAMLLKPLGLKSQHIVGLSAFEEDPEEGLLYFTMEYVDGENLSQLLIKDGPLPWERAYPIMDQVLDALITAHEEEIVHRDMKLENVMITKDKRGDDVAKVLDFGIAKPLGQQSLTNLALGGPGTPGYAAPEQLEAGEIDQRTDLFALGVVYYGVLTGREPWLGGVITEPTSKGLVIMTQTLKGDPIPPRKWNEDIPDWVEEFIFKLLEKKPEDRWQTAYELRDHIRSKMAGPELPVAVTPDFASLAVTTVDPSSGEVAEGVAIRVRKGRKVVAEGRSPWSADSLEPGRYEIELRDSSYEMDSREVELVVGSVAEVKLNAVVKVQDLGRLEVEAYGDEEGVEVRVKQGRKVVAEGLTPWVNDELEVGEYEVQVVDKRFKRTSRHIRIAKGETTSAKLGIKEANVWDKFGNYIMAGGATVVAAAVIGVIAFGGGGGGAVISLEEFQAHLDAGEVLDVRVRDGQILGNLAAGGNFQVEMAGLNLQDMVQRLDEQGLLLAPRGEGTIVFSPVDAETSDPVQGDVQLTLSADDATEVCGGPCRLGEDVPVNAGWYSVGSQLGDEFRLVELLLRDQEEVYADEPLARDATRFFVPANDRIEVLVRLGRSELGLNIQEARNALNAGNLTQANTYLRSVQQEDPTNATAIQIAREVAQAGIGSGDANSVREAILLVQDMDENDPELETLRSGLADIYATRAEDLLGRGGDPTLQLALCDQWAPTPDRCDSVRAQAEAAQAEQAEEQTDPGAEVTQTPAPRQQSPEELAQQQEDDARAALNRGDLTAAAEAAANCIGLRGGSDAACEGIQADVVERREAAALQTRIDTYLANARSRLAEGNYDGARQAITNCLTADDGNAQCTSLGEEIDNAEELAEQIDALEQQAQTALDNENWAEAVSRAQECLDLQSGNTTCTNIRNQANSQQQAAANEAARQARQDSIDTFRRDAEAALANENLDEAERAADACLVMDPGNAACNAVLDGVEEIRSRPAAPAVAGLSIASAGTEGGGIGRSAEVVAAFTASGPQNTTFCVAAFFTPSDGRNLVPKSDEYTVAGTVATFRELALSGTSQQESAFSLTLPADELRIENTGDHPMTVQLGIWAQGCPPPGSPSGAEWTATTDMCIARDFGGDWYPECGEERPDR